MRLLPTALVVAAGCDLGVVAAPDALPPAEDFGVVVSPRTGDLIVDHDAAAIVVVEGFHTRPGQEIEIQALVAPFDRASSWQTVATARTDDEAIDDVYPFSITVGGASLWPRGGLLHLRALVDGEELAGFFDDSEECFEDAGESWRNRAAACANEYAGGGIVLASVDLGPLGVLGSDERYLDDKGRITPEETLAYYAAIDAPPTLTEFRARYLLADQASAFYYNAGDLGIGREMHCGTFPAGAGPGVGCYVANYGEFGGSRAVAEGALVAGVAAGGAVGELATVAMVYRPPIEADGAVQFMLYGANEALAVEAVLDTHGDNASVPNNCLSCHGTHASYDELTERVKDARFLPFDPAAFSFIEEDGFRRADQEDQLRRLNELVLATDPGFGSRELILGMYGEGLEVAGTVADEGFVPDGWSGESAEHVYREVIAPYCRGCHASREVGGGADSLDFTDEAGFLAVAATIADVVCTRGNEEVHRMPDAEVTQQRFWTGRARAYLAAIIDLGGPCLP